MKKNELQYELDDILNVFSNLDSKERVFEFMLDIMSENEMIELSKRFEVAKMLEEGISYSRIEKKTRMSSATIAKISKALNWENMWYKNALNIVDWL